MKISDELKEKIERVFKDKKEIKDNLLSGDSKTIKELAIIAQKGIKPEDIVEAYENNTVANLYEKAKMLIDLQEIYIGLCNLCLRQEDSKQAER